MQFSKFLLGLATLASANALVQFTNSNFTGITIGQPFLITWDNNVGTVTLLLKNGPKAQQILVRPIASGLSGTSYSWTPKEIVSGIYNLEIDDSNGDVNYSEQFPISRGNVATTSVSTPSRIITSTTGGSSSDSSTTTEVRTTYSSSTTATVTSSPIIASSVNSTSTCTSTNGTAIVACSATSTNSVSTPTSTLAPIKSNAAALYTSSFGVIMLGLAAIVHIN